MDEKVYVTHNGGKTILSYPLSVWEKRKDVLEKRSFVLATSAQLKMHGYEVEEVKEKKKKPKRKKEVEVEIPVEEPTATNDIE